MTDKDLYYLTNDVDSWQEESAEDLTETVTKTEEDGLFAVQSETDEEKEYMVKLLCKHRSDLPDFQVPKCKHILAVEKSFGDDLYHNSWNNEEPENDEKALVGYCTCPGVQKHNKEPLQGALELDVEPEVVNEEKEESTALEEVETGASQLTDLVADIDQLKERYNKFEQLKTSLLTKSDMQKAGNNSFVKKSGWRKIATAFGLSLEKLGEERYKEDGYKVVEVKYQAIAPNGQHQDATAKCSFGEENIQGRIATARSKAENMDDEDKADRKIAGAKAKLVHDVAATAETRAKNRAISDLVGGGEVSYEEVRG